MHKQLGPHARAFEPRPPKLQFGASDSLMSRLLEEPTRMHTRLTCYATATDARRMQNALIARQNGRVGVLVGRDNRKKKKEPPAAPPPRRQTLPHADIHMHARTSFLGENC